MYNNKHIQYTHKCKKMSALGSLGIAQALKSYVGKSSWASLAVRTSTERPLIASPARRLFSQLPTDVSLFS